MAPYSSADCGFLLVGPYDICTVTGEIEDNTDDTPVEKTMFGTNAATFLPAVVRKYALSQTGLYDDSAGSIDDAMVALRASQNVLLLGYEGNVLGRHARAVGAALRASYARTGFAVGDYVGTKADITANGVAEDALIVAPLAAVVASGNSEAGYLDLGAPAAAGCSVYVVCTHLSGMDYLDVSLMHSADHVAWVTQTAMTRLTAAGAEKKVATNMTVYRYLAEAHVVGNPASTPTATFVLAAKAN